MTEKERKEMSAYLSRRIVYTILWVQLANVKTEALEGKGLLIITGEVRDQAN
jgi:hypothetical protein